MRVDQYHFFLSYARSDDHDSVRRFFHDLSAEVRSHAGLPADADVGFLDVQSLEYGAAWSPEVLRALADCRTFVALISPRYQLSEMCGREWTIFASRLTVLEERGQRPPPALLPVLWLPPEDLHPAVAAVQYQSSAMPEAYHRTGLRQLIRLQRHQDDYYELVVELAHHIVRVASQPHVPRPPEGLDLHRAPSVFHSGPQALLINPQSQQVQFVVAAPTQADLEFVEIAAVSRDRHFYGVTPEDWAPYRPVLEIPLAEYARAIAVERSFRADVTDLGGLMDWLDRSPTANQIVVLLVDPWTTRLRAHRQTLAECDHRTDGWLAVMIPTSADDQQTQDHLTYLMDSLRAVFVRRLAAGEDVGFRTSILSHQAFGADLRVLLERLRNRLFTTGIVHRRPPGGTGQRPILRGP